MKNGRCKLPYYDTYMNIIGRCNNKKNMKYGGRGISCLITLKELGKLYERDKASLMLRPSIDRINSNGNYSYENCRFLELSENSKSFLGRKRMDSSKIKIGKSHFGMKRSLESKLKMSIAAKKRSPDTRIYGKCYAENGPDGRFIKKEISK